MYVSVPKNYSGIAFPHSSSPPSPKRPENNSEKSCCDAPASPQPSPPPQPPPPPPPAQKCEKCSSNEKNPLSCLLSALRGRGKSGFDTEDFLLIGLIALLVGREGNEDILLILAMLLLI